MSPASARRTNNILKAAINHAIREHDLPIRNPVASLEFKGSDHTRDRRLPFTEDDMATLASVMETDDARGDLWVILRDTGARLREICNLRAMDYDARHDSIHIRPYGKHTLKTRNSEREVPLSPEAKRRVEKLCENAKGEEPLFPKYAGGRLSDHASGALMKRVRTKIVDPKKAVHSLRHRMKDRLRDTDCPEVRAREIMGHSMPGEAANYGRGTALELRREALERVWNGDIEVEANVAKQSAA